jgi:hypothetical protein
MIDNSTAGAAQPFFTGFTFGNTPYRSPESMHELGETLRLSGG